MGYGYRAAAVVAIATGFGVLVYCIQWSNVSTPQKPSWKLSDMGRQACPSCTSNQGAKGDNSESTDSINLLPLVDSTPLLRTLKRNYTQMLKRLNYENALSSSCSTSPLPNSTLPSNHDIPIPPSFLAESKNPCWWNVPEDSTEPKLKCMPYYFLAGVSKCGSTDIFSRLSGHPQVVPPYRKEARWFDRRRWVFGKFPFDWYESNFAQASWQIARDLKRHGTSRKVVGDGSPTYFWRNSYWPQYAGNEGCSEPRVVIPNALQRLLPRAKIIISFRNPSVSIYSKYLSRADKGVDCSPRHFHSLVVKEIQRYQDCFAHFSIRSCAYNYTLSAEAEVRLEKGLYAVFLADWFRVFSRKQIHIIRFEDYIKDIQGHLMRLFDFLELDAMGMDELHRLATLPPSNTGRHYVLGKILPQTKRLLLQFYAPFNAHLADMLNDKAFLWSH